MMDRPSEVADYHTRMLRCSIEIEHSRSYWQHMESEATADTAAIAFSNYWFGARSMPRVEILLTNFRERFDDWPPALSVLHSWTEMEAGDRRAICHWHLQLADRLYREFTGSYLVERRDGGRADVNRDLGVRWVEQQAPERWTMSTRIQFARKLLFSASEVGLLSGARDPRQLQLPRISDAALTYLLYLLRGISIQGTLTDNPYLTSVGLTDKELDRRLRSLQDISFRRQGDLIELGWRYDSLIDWANATILNRCDRQLRGSA